MINFHPNLCGVLLILVFSDAQKMSNKEAYEALKKTVASVKKSCGEVCDTSIAGKQGKYYDEITKNVDCPALFSNSDLDEPSKFVEPPVRIPKWLLNDYNYNEQIEIVYWYKDSAYLKDISPLVYNFTTSLTDEMNKLMDHGVYEGPYGKPMVDKIDRYLKTQMEIKDKHVLIIGSESPWIEVLALRNGAKHVTTLEYSKIHNEIPEITTLLPEDFNSMFLDKSLPTFDFVISFSSVEHSGLGRYGDSLNPWGDLITMARAWCVLKKGGQALIGMPTGPDTVVFNTHRIYGPVMLPHLFANFKQIYSELDYKNYDSECSFCYQELFVLEK